jgi:hypothetical protein
MELTTTVHDSRLSVFSTVNGSERPGTTRLVRALLASGEDASPRSETALREAVIVFACEAQARRESPQQLVVALKTIFARLDGRTPSLADAAKHDDSSSGVRYGVWYPRAFAWCLDAYFSADACHGSGEAPTS